MANKGAQRRQGATDSGIRPGCFALGSAQSRAAARALLVARNASDEGNGVQVVYRADGAVAEIRGRAERIRAARMKNQDGKLPASLPAIESGQDWSEGGRTDCLSERVRKARERVTRAQSPVTTL